MNTPLIAINNLSIAFQSGSSLLPIVHHVSITIGEGEIAALVGESGSGKSLTARSLLQLLPHGATITSGTAMFDGRDLLSMEDTDIHTVRGNRIGMVFQDPLASLNPLHTVGKQVAEAITAHTSCAPSHAKERVLELFSMVQLDNPHQRYSAYPHQLSGGQRQRVMLAMALANSPRLLIADEPTTSLDAAVQLEILNVISQLNKRLGMAVLLITHDLNVVRNLADKVHVMQQGSLVESGVAKKLFAAPQHPYTQSLLSTPSTLVRDSSCSDHILLSAHNLTVSYPVKRSLFGKVTKEYSAARNINLTLARGECVGLVGESGSGKTSLGLALLRLIPAKGTITLNGTDISALSGAALRQWRKKIQVVFQDPFSSLSPRLPIASIISEGAVLHGFCGPSKKQREDFAEQALAEVGLGPEYLDRYPHELSGGQRQRIAIARALAVEPEILVLDEPTSSLDRNLQFKILELLQSIQNARRMACLFITHDLVLVQSFCNRVVVLQQGEIVESSPTKELFTHPRTRYTKTLLQAAFGTMPDMA